MGIAGFNQFDFIIKPRKLIGFVHTHRAAEDDHGIIVKQVVRFI